MPQQPKTSSEKKRTLGAALLFLPLSKEAQVVTCEFPLHKEEREKRELISPAPHAGGQASGEESVCVHRAGQG